MTSLRATGASTTRDRGAVDVSIEMLFGTVAWPTRALMSGPPQSLTIRLAILLVSSTRRPENTIQKPGPKRLLKPVYRFLKQF